MSEEYPVKEVCKSIEKGLWSFPTNQLYPQLKESEIYFQFKQKLEAKKANLEAKKKAFLVNRNKLNKAKRVKK